MAANTMGENKIMLNDILQKMENGFNATAQELKEIRAEMETGFRGAAKERGALTQDLQSFRAAAQKEIGALTQNLQSFRSETQARFARSTSEVGEVFREVGDYLEKKIVALHAKFLSLHRISLNTAQAVKESYAEQEEKLLLLEQEEK